jgi:hypothetical protein
MKLRVLSVVSAVVFIRLGLPATAQADTPPFVFPDGCCYLDGVVVRTVVPPAATPDAGRDNFYAVMGGVVAQ